jgi:small subunit ribosomal protein S17
MEKKQGEINKRRIKGVVVSAKMDKTVAVRIERKIPHPKYKKIQKKSNKLLARCQNPSIKEGDIVLLQECKPYSKNVSYEVIEVSS